ncbi:MAG: beta-glucosidase [Alphaproteobacteria bacterium]|nr:beta-glucosidase [Alphaproteobacteria bacterium]
MTPSVLLKLDDDALMEAVARQTFRFFWEGAEPASFMARDRTTRGADPSNDLVAVGGTGFGVMALIVAVERGWIARDAALARLDRMLQVLERAERHHGAYPHFLHGETGRTIPFMPNDDGGDLVETALLMMGLLAVRQYFAADAALAARITALFDGVEWDWYRRGEDVLYWHWSPNHGWAMNHSIRGWNETLIVYVLAAGASRHAIDRDVYEKGFCRSADYSNGKTYRGVTLPLGPDGGGPLFFAHYSFCGLDPHGLSDRHADYWQQNVAQVAVNRDHCIANPGRFKGYGPDCWGLTASDDPSGYDAHAPNNDNGTISPTAALASIPYAPQAAMAAMRHFLSAHGDKVWGRFGFVDAFNETRDWWADTYLAIDQGPIVVMTENYRSGLLWKLFMAAPEVRKGLARLGFASAEA